MIDQLNLYNGLFIPIFIDVKQDSLLLFNENPFYTNWNFDAENQFKSGDELSGCATQKKASKYGIEATKSLIKAMEDNESPEGIKNLETGLNKWRELGDFC